jgi:hypothetical protein
MPRQPYAQLRAPNRAAGCRPHRPRALRRYEPLGCCIVGLYFSASRFERVNRRFVRCPNHHARERRAETGDVLRTLNKLVLVALFGVGAVVAAGVGFVAYGVFVNVVSPWVAFLLSAAGIPNSKLDRIDAAIMTPEAWLYYAPVASVLLYFVGIAVFCCSRSPLLRRRNRAQQTS